MDILPAENSDVTDDDEEVKEVRRPSPLTFEADGDFPSEVRAGLYAGWFLKLTRPTSAIRDTRLNLDPTLRSLFKVYSNAASHCLAVSTDIPKAACELYHDTPLESSATMLYPTRYPYSIPLLVRRGLLQSKNFPQLVSEQGGQRSTSGTSQGPSPRGTDSLHCVTSSSSAVLPQTRISAS
jgi:hypothetical protein